MKRSNLQEFNKTYESAIKALKTYRICNIERPTAFGKTTLLVKYAKEHKKERICFVEFSRAKIKELEDENKRLKNIKYMTYNAISKDPDKFIERLSNREFDIIFFDESHRCGAKKIREKWDIIRQVAYKNDIRILGCTGTAFRTTDGIDVTKEMFLGISTYKYDVNDAYKDSYIYLPEYYACRGNYTKEEKEELKRNLKDSKDIRLIEQVSNLGHIIKDVIDTEKIKDDYYKFIIYYSKIDEINNSIEELRGQLEKEFKGYNINMLPITSDIDHMCNIDVINYLNKRQNTIDILLTVNMMNEGFHLKDLTGIVLVRRTTSALVYTQQIGRCITMNKHHKMVVIDVAGNIHTEFTVHNPLSKLYNRNICRDTEKLDNDVKILRVKMTQEQIKLERVLGKLNYIREKLFILTVNNFKRMYVANGFKNKDLLSICMRCGVDGFNTPKDIYEKVIDTWRDEDRIENVPSDYISNYGDKYIAWGIWYSVRHTR